MFPIQLLLSVPVYFLWKRFPDKTILQYSQAILGGAGKLAGVLYIWFFLHMAVITLCEICSFMTSIIMQETPFIFLIIYYVIFCAYAVRKGIEVIGRISEIIAPIVIVGIASIFLLLIKDMSLKALAPVIEEGFSPLLYGGLYASTLTTEILGIAILLSYLNEWKKVKSVFVLSFALIAIFFFLMTISVLTVFGSEIAKSHTFAFYSAARLISIGDFLERLESIYFEIWVLGTAQLLNLKDYKPLVLPTGAVIISLTLLIVESIIELRELMSYMVCIVFYIIYPIRSSYYSCY